MQLFIVCILCSFLLTGGYSDHNIALVLHEYMQYRSLANNLVRKTEGIRSGRLCAEDLFFISKYTSE